MVRMEGLPALNLWSQLIECLTGIFMKHRVAQGLSAPLPDQSAWRKYDVMCLDNADYVPPKGVKGEYDRINQIESKEQSLALKFTNLR